MAAWARLMAAGNSPLQVTFRRPPPTLFLVGEADESSYPQLTAALTAAATAGDKWLLIDLAGLTYCDLAGLRAIVSLPAGQVPDPAADRCRPMPAARQAAAGALVPEASVRRVVLRDPPGPVRAALSILGWDEAPGVTLEAPS